MIGIVLLVIFIFFAGYWLGCNVGDSSYLDWSLLEILAIIGICAVFLFFMIGCILYVASAFL